MLLSKCGVWESNKLSFIKNQEASALSNHLELKSLLSKFRWYFDLKI